MSKLGTQNEMVLELLLDGPLTSAEAMKEIGCHRLAARIKDLRNRGYNIITTTESDTNRFGRPVKFARYELVPVAAAA